MLRLVLAMLLLPPAMAGAACLDAESLASGIYFTREGGENGVAIAAGRNLVRIDYALGRNDKTHLMTGRYGIYTETSSAWSGDPEVVGGSGGSSTTYRRSGNPPEPTPGETWKTRLRTTRETDTNTADGVVTTRERFDVVYSFQDARTVRLSGCDYMMVPVEATFIGETAHFSYRWAYFPDLGVGLETRYTDHRNGINLTRGLTALRAPQ